MFSAYANGLHALAAVLWVGGMFFAHMALRPAALDLPPAQRLPLWRSVLRRFFLWVWIAISVLLITGFAVIFLDYGGFAGLPLYIHLMTGVGLLMVVLFVTLFALPYRAFCQAVAQQDWPAAATHLARLRRLVVTNLILGLMTTALGASGRFW